MTPLRRALRRGITGLDALYALGLAALSVLNAIGPEQTWFGSLNLYLPQWIWLLPGIPLLLLTLLIAWRRAWIPLLCLLWVAWPIMGYCPRLTAPARHTGGLHLRVMTYNVKGGQRDLDAVMEDIKAFHPDVIQTQDSESVLNGPLSRALTGWYVCNVGQYITLSRYPLNAAFRPDISFPNSNHHCLRVKLTVGDRSITLYNVHLLSPRDGLVSVRHLHVSGIKENTRERLVEAERLAEDLRPEQGPLILTGDLNAPVQSLVCRKLFDLGLRDAFSEAGQGYGYSYGQYTRLGQPYVRIDHIMVSAPWQVEACWTGNTLGSDHIPVIADLFLPAAH